MSVTSISYCLTIATNIWHCGSHRIFLPIVEMFQAYLHDQGIKAYISRYPYCDSLTRCVYFGANMLPDCIPENAIVVDLEQHHDSRKQEFQDYLQILSTREVWTYSKRNLQWLRQNRVEATYVPIFYHPCLERQIKIQTKTIDVILIGCDVHRRSQVLSAIRAAIPKSRVVLVNNLWGDTLNKVIDSTRIVLHLSQYDHSNIFPVARILPLMANGACVVAETFTDDDEYHYLHPGLVICPVDEIVEKVQFYLADEYQRQLISTTAKEVVTHRQLDLPLIQIETTAIKNVENQDFTDSNQQEVCRCLRSICWWLCYEEQHHHSKIFELLGEYGLTLETAWVPNGHWWVPILFGMEYSQQNNKRCWVSTNNSDLAVIEKNPKIVLGDPEGLVDLCFCDSNNLPDLSKVQHTLIAPSTAPVNDEWTKISQSDELKDWAIYQRSTVVDS